MIQENVSELLRRASHEDEAKQNWLSVIRDFQRADNSIPGGLEPSQKTAFLEKATLLAGAYDTAHVLIGEAWNSETPVTPYDE